MESSNFIKVKDFDKIYIEQSIINHPNTKKITSKFPKARIISIRDYKEVFNRSTNDKVLKNSARSIILAKKKDNLLYKGSYYAPDFGADRFFYTTPALNCIYDCSYCYLKGMFSSNNLVLFVNQEDFFSQTISELDNGPVYLCISYDTDLLAIENIFPYVASWYDLTRKYSKLTIELRTKSVAFSNISSLEPVDNFVLAWTVSPQAIVDKYEFKTPSETARIKVMTKAIKKGWKVRLCIDPILPFEGWEQDYSSLLSNIFSEVQPNNFKDISLGSFRINSEFLKSARLREERSELLFYPFDVKEGVASFGERRESQVYKFMMERLSGYGSTDNVSFHHS